MMTLSLSTGKDLFLATTSALLLTSACLEAASPPAQAVRLGSLRQTTTLLGNTVKDPAQRTVGTLQDVLVDLSSGQIVAGLISAGADAQITPVPARLFFAGDTDKILISADRKIFQSAPHFPRPTLSRALDASELDETFRHFGQHGPQLPAPGGAAYVLGSSLLGQSLVSQTGETVGHVQDLMIDLPRARLAYLVIKPALGPAQDSSLYVIPPSAVQAETTAQALRLEANQARFLAGPHFQRDFWPLVASPEMAAAVAQHYSLQHPALSGSETRQPVRARVELPAGPSPTKSALSDDQITDAILLELVHYPNVAMGRDVKLSVRNGQVTITGQAGDTRQRQQIAAAAQRVAGAANVDNQLETLYKPTALR